MKKRTLSLPAIFLFVFLFPVSFASAAGDADVLSDTTTGCCLPVVEKEIPLLEAKVYLEPGDIRNPFPFPSEPRPSERSGRPKKRSVDLSEQTWDEEKYDVRDRWTLKDTLYQTQYAVLHIIDWGQTRYIADSDEFYEMNPVLGANPTKEAVDLYFAVTLVSHTAISFILPEKWRRKWQFFWIGLESFITASNSSAGVAISF